jgi:hypothetical protein
MLIALWFTGSVVLSFVLGWAVGTYGYSIQDKIEPSRLIAAHLMEANRGMFQ